MKPNALIFDLDGVLLDSEKAWQDAIEKAVAEHGGFWSDTDRATMDRHMTPKGWSTHIKERAALEIDAEDLRQSVLDNLEKIYYSNLPLIENARETILNLSDYYPIALATGSDRQAVDAFLAGSNLRDHFSLTLAAEDVSRGKPDPEIYLKALRELKVQPESTLAIEDSDVGIRASLAAGIPTVCFLDDNFPPEKETLKRVSLILRKLSALEELLLGSRKSNTFSITFQQK